jgi:hypothetical protein
VDTRAEVVSDDGIQVGAVVIVSVCAGVCFRYFFPHSRLSINASFKIAGRLQEFFPDHAHYFNEERTPFLFSRQIQCVIGHSFTP